MTYLVLEEADTDIADILEYIDDDEVAHRFNRAFLKAFGSLGDSPMIGHRREDLTQRDLRFWPVRHWLVVHRGRDPVEIVAVLDARRDLVSLLR